MLQPAIWILLADWTLRILISVRVIMKRRPIGLSLAWLLIVLLFPIVGTLVYLILGENRLGRKRSKWATHMRRHYQIWKERQQPYIFDQWEPPRGDPAQLSQMVHAASDSAPLRGNCIDLFRTSEATFAAMIKDINQAKQFCHLEFYIWEVGGLADEMSQSLAAAAKRGVQCRILVDAVGARGFLKSSQAAELRAQGAEIHAALPVNLMRAFLYRFDLRLHRKIVVIDNEIGYVGSQNMADPKIFRRGAGFGEWIDAMVRVRGPAVDALEMVFSEDWQFETTRPSADKIIDEKLPIPSPQGKTIVQVVPSGPGIDAEAVTQILLNAIYMADKFLTITTPYFVPDESLQRALISAARRGVQVTMIVPMHIDSKLVRLAGRPFLRELAKVGVRIVGFRKGLLHTKSITIDNDTSFFGSLNLDPRSLNLNFEIMLALYDKAFTSELIALQKEYIAHSGELTLAELSPGGFGTRFVEDCARLISPLL